MLVGNILVNLKCNTSQITTGMDTAKRQTAIAMREMRKEVGESNHSLALMGEAFGVTVPRHIRSFVSELPGVSKVMSTAFNGLAIFLVIKVLAEAKDKVIELKKAFEEAKDAPEKIRSSFQLLHGEFQSSNDKLALVNDQLRNTIAQLEGKPVNNLAIALDEARVHANELATSLENGIKKAADLLEKNKASFLQKTLFGVSGDEDIADQNSAYAQRRTELTQDHQLKIHSGNLNADQIKAEKDAFTEEMLKLERAREQWLSGQIGATQVEKGNLNALGDDGSRFDPRLNKLRGLRSLAIDDETGTQLDSDNQNLKGRLPGAQAASAAAKQLAEFRHQMLELTLSAVAELNKIPTAAGKLSAAPGKDDQKGLEDISANTVEWTKALGQSLFLQGKNTEATEEANIKYQEAVGNISAIGAAMQIAQLRAKGYSDSVAILQNRLKEISSSTFLRDDEKRLRTQQTKNQITVLTGQMNVENTKAAGDADSLTATAGVHQFWQSVISDSQDSARTVHQAMSQAMEAVNGELARAMTGQHTSWGRTFQGVGTSAISSGLKMGEGAIASALGLGKRGDSMSRPLFVQDVTSALKGVGSIAGGSLGKFGGFLSSLHIPGFADGGDPTGLSIVGENGPELRSFPAGTHITNNSDLRSMMRGGGKGDTYHVDARGSNPAEVEARMQRVAIMAHNQAVITSATQRREQAARRPSRARY